MTEAQAVEAITQAFITGWTAANSSIPYALDNEAFETAATWARFTIVHSTGSQRTIGPAGSRKFERSGNLAVQLFVPVNAGKATIADLADDVRGFLEGARITSSADTEPIHTYTGSTVNETTDGAWFSATVVVPFSYWQTR